MTASVRLQRGKIKLRPVTTADAVDLLRWKNDPETRRNSIVTQDEIKLEDHLIWLRRTLDDSTIQFFIVELEGKPIGDLRLNPLDTGETEISIRLDVSTRGLGIATQVIGMVRGLLLAKIVSHNVASMRSFIANGFRPEAFIEGLVSYYLFKK